MERIIIPEYMESTIDSYFSNNAKKLYKMVDNVLFKMHFPDVDKNDFYSLANEVFMYAIRDYDPSKSFDVFLYSCLYKKFCSEITNRRRDKRCVKIKIKEKDENGNVNDRIVIVQNESLDAPIEGDENCTLGEVIAGRNTVENEIFEKNEDIYSDKMLLYLSRLSVLQKEILRLNMAGYLPNEIREELHISEKQYADSCAAIQSYRNISVLF